MTRLIRRHRMNFSVSVPEGVSQEVLESIIAAAVAEMGGSTSVPSVKKKSVKRAPLATRTIKNSGMYPCRREPDPLHAAAIIWPKGAPHRGCGRTYGTEKRRDIHEAGTGWNAKVFPNGCLDRIIPMEMRDDR